MTTFRFFHCDLKVKKVVVFVSFHFGFRFFPQLLSSIEFVSFAVVSVELCFDRMIK